MRNEEAWTPTKFVLAGERWRASRNRKEIAVSSRLIGDLAVRCYQNALETYASGDLVDLGCGKVPLYGIYRRHVDHVVCVDWEKSHYGNRFVDYAMDLNGRFDLLKASFDTVLATDVLEHIYDADVFWSEMTRICRPGGHIILGTPFLYWLHDTPYDYARYTRYNLIFRCEQNGLQIVSLEEFGGAPEVLMDIILKQFRHWPKLCSWLDGMFRLILRMPACRRQSHRTREHFPLGYCLVAHKV